MELRTNQHRVARDQRLPGATGAGGGHGWCACGGTPDSPRARRRGRRGPEGAVFAGADLDAQYFSVAGGGHADGHHDGAGHATAVGAGTDVGGAGEHAGELAVVEAAVLERFEVAVQLRRRCG